MVRKYVKVRHCAF